MGKPGSGKSTILNGIRQRFGGYVWNTKSTQFQSQDILQASAVIVDEFPVHELYENSRVCNSWKLRFDQLQMSTCDFKGKTARECTRLMPFFIATNQDHKTFRQKISPAISRRTRVVFFPGCFRQVQQQMKD